METTAPASRTFAYRAQTAADRPVSGTIDAADHDEARRLLEGMGLRVLEMAVTPLAAPGTPGAGDPVAAGNDKSRPLMGVRGRPGGADFLAFNQQLAYMANAGMPVETGLRLIARETRSRRMARAIEQIAADAEAGRPLGLAFDAQRNTFPPLYGRLVDAGVRSGNLPGVLFNLGQHMEMVQRLRAVLWQNLSYPAVILIATALLLLVLGAKILPQFRAIFVDFNTSLPALTVLVLDAATWLPALLVAFVILLIGLPILWLALLPLQPVIIDAVFLPLPLLGPVLRASRSARWCDAVRLGIEAGLDLPRAIAIAGDVMSSPKLRHDGERLTEAIQSGQRFDQVRGLSVLSEAVAAAIELASNSPGGSSPAESHVSATTSGTPGATGTRETRGTPGTPSTPGTLAIALGNLARMFQQQAETRLRLLDVILTPIMMASLAVILGFVILALFLPLVKLINSLI